MAGPSGPGSWHTHPHAEGTLPPNILIWLCLLPGLVFVFVPLPRPSFRVEGFKGKAVFCVSSYSYFPKRCISVNQNFLYCLLIMVRNK